VQRKSLIAVVAAIFILAACQNSPAKLTAEQVTDLAQVYFKDLYGASVTVEKAEYEQVGSSEYRNFVTVSNGDTEYTLILDENNKPLSDNVSEIEIIKAIDISKYKEKIEPLGLKLYAHKELEPILSGLQYQVWFSVVSEDRPDKDKAGKIYSLLSELKNDGIDRFVLNINSPGFLLFNEYDLWLAGAVFDTDIDIARFEEQYYGFVDGIYWNEQKFNDKILELAQMGYKNAFFYISGWVDGKTIEIVLYCESDTSLSDEPAIAELEKMDDSYFKIGENEVKYTLQLS